MSDNIRHTIIDSHQHFWEYNQEKHDWISDEMVVIRKSFLPSDLRSAFEKNDVDGCIAVQADQSLAENDFLLKLAENNSFIKGIIGWVDFQNYNVESDIQKYADDELIKGFRHVVQSEPDPKFLLRPNFLRGIKLLEGTNLVYEILVFPHQLPTVYEFVKLFPNITFVLDHIGKPYIKEGYFDGWATMIEALGELENLNCKISGLVTEADYNTWSMEQLMPYMKKVLEAFGPKRILYGSDWPVCLVAASYSEVLNVAKEFSSQLSEHERSAFFHLNSERIYHL